MSPDLTTHDTEVTAGQRVRRPHRAHPSVRARSYALPETTGEAAVAARLSRALGWFSLGLGLAEVIAPRGVARAIGVEDDDTNRRLLRGMGMREIASGLAILAQPASSGRVWGRVAGDVVDLAFLGSALKSDTSKKGRVIGATAAVLGVTALDVYCANRLRDGDEEEVDGAMSNAVEIRTAVTIGRSPDEVYRFWRDFENLPRFMHHLEAVRITGERTSHWKAKAPIGMAVEWDAEIIEDRRNELIAWQSLEGGDVDNAGSIRFQAAPADRGTEVILEMRYRPPGGVVGAKLAKLFDEIPRTQMRNDLRRFKQVIETGEVVHSDASIEKGPNPAQPPEHAPLR